MLDINDYFCRRIADFLCEEDELYHPLAEACFNLVDAVLIPMESDFIKEPEDKSIFDAMAGGVVYNILKLNKEEILNINNNFSKILDFNFIAKYFEVSVENLKLEAIRIEEKYLSRNDLSLFMFDHDPDLAYLDEEEETDDNEEDISEEMQTAITKFIVHFCIDLENTDTDKINALLDEVRKKFAIGKYADEGYEDVSTNLFRIGSFEEDEDELSFSMRALYLFILAFQDLMESAGIKYKKTNIMEFDDKNFYRPDDSYILNFQSHYKMFDNFEFKSEDDIKRRIEEYNQKIKDIGYDAIEMKDDDAIALCYYDLEMGESVMKCVEMLKGNPNAIEPYLCLAGWDFDLFKRLNYLELAIETGKNRFKDLEDDDSHDEKPWWGFIATRPYLRAKEKYGFELIDGGYHEDGIEELYEIITMNPDDNLGIRYGLMAFYLEYKDLAGIQKLVKLFPNDDDVRFIYMKAYCLFISFGKKHRTEKAVNGAIKEDPILAYACIGFEEDMYKAIGKLEENKEEIIENLIELKSMMKPMFSKPFLKYLEQCIGNFKFND